MDSSSIRTDHKTWVRMFDVGDPRRHEKGFTVYKVTSKVFPMTDPAGLTTLTVWKRYNDFKQLHSELEQIHRQLYLPGKFPAFPKASRFNRFDYEVIQERRAAALLLLQFLGNHVQLFTSRIFNKFFEEGYDPKDLPLPSYSNSTVTTATVDEARQPDPATLLPDCLEPEIVWTLSPSTTPKPNDGGDENSSSSIVSLASEDETDSCGSVFSSVSKSRSVRAMGAGVPKSQSELVMPTFLADSAAEFEILEELESSDEHLQPTKSTHSQSTVRIQSDSSSPPYSADGGAVSLNPISSLSRKFGILDFLPKFPKRDKEVKVSEEKLLSQALSSSYICEAAGHFAMAQDNESNGNFEAAFSSYKEGIRILLAGAKNDEDTKRKALVKQKLEKYLSRAESIHDQFVSSKRSPSAFNSPIRNFLEKSRHLSNHHETSKCRPFSLDELNDYKIIRVIHRRVYLAVHISAETALEPRCYAIKVLPFSSDPIELDKKTVIPEDNQFMVKLFKWFETDSAYILLLQYAGGGRLIDYVRSYQRKQSIVDDFNSEITCLSPEEMHIHIENKNGVIATISPASTQDATDALEEQENAGTPSLQNASTFADLMEVIKMPRAPLGPQNQYNTKMDAVSVVSSKDKEVYAQSVEENTLHPAQSHNMDVQTYSNKSSAEDLIECSKELLESVNKALEKVKRPFSLAGEFLSKSLEDVSLSRTPVAMFDGRLMEPKNPMSNVIVKVGGTEMMIEDEEELPTRTVPEGCIKGWAAEIIMFLDKFHSCGLIYGDLGMDNILLGESGHILISFKAQWSKMDQLPSPLTTNEYSAPEVVQSSGESSWKLHPSCDFWSLGAILFELFTGQSVHNCHPEGFHPQTVIRIPCKDILGETISSDVRSLLTELLEVNPSLRLGFYGADEVKSHPCFDGFDWE